MIQMKFVPRGRDAEDAFKQSGWIDEELESDGLNLEEWAFWHGYNDED